MPVARPILLVLLASFVMLDCDDVSQEYLACSFIPVEEPTDVVPNCAYRNENGDIVVETESFETVHFGDDGVAAVVIEEELLYVNPKGRTAPALPFDNGVDYFVEGLARTRAGGKIGFIDKNLDVVITPEWDFAFPFKQGLSVVCNGCAARPVGEHSEVVGGRWGYIDRNGDAVVSVTFSREELPPPKSVSRPQP